MYSHLQNDSMLHIALPLDQSLCTFLHNWGALHTENAVSTLLPPCGNSMVGVSAVPFTGLANIECLETILHRYLQIIILNH